MSKEHKDLKTNTMDEQSQNKKKGEILTDRVRTGTITSMVPNKSSGHKPNTDKRFQWSKSWFKIEIEEMGLSHSLTDSHIPITKMT